MTSSAEHTQEGASRFALLKPSSIINVPLSHEDLVTISQVQQLFMPSPPSYFVDLLLPFLFVLCVGFNETP